ncbi:MAG TPA: hypothetical protein PKD24_09780 [Pyrinomonadaceae bacterium]|nr:hypothetical protein [Pyrinomonadaceae bacterium]HMP65642.1 hypothetical protein [Pyrinomonadaceae bacterium]
MKHIKWVVSLILFALCSVTTVAQERDDELDKVFGEPFRNPCIVGNKPGPVRFCRYYNFNEDYKIGVLFDKDYEVLKVYLVWKGPAEETARSISLGEKKQFLDKIGQLRCFGPPLFSGEPSQLQNANTNLWEIYENMAVSFSFKGLENESPVLMMIVAHFPFDLLGKVTSVKSFPAGGEENKLIEITIDGSLYLSRDQSISPGDTRNVRVILP